jgi:hypothetical protein
MRADSARSRRHGRDRCFHGEPPCVSCPGNAPGSGPRGASACAAILIPRRAVEI